MTLEDKDPDLRDREKTNSEAKNVAIEFKHSYHTSGNSEQCVNQLLRHDRSGGKRLNQATSSRLYLSVPISSLAFHSIHVQ